MCNFKLELQRQQLLQERQHFHLEQLRATEFRQRQLAAQQLLNEGKLTIPTINTPMIAAAPVPAVTVTNTATINQAQNQPAPIVQQPAQLHTAVPAQVASSSTFASSSTSPAPQSSSSPAPTGAPVVVSAIPNVVVQQQQQPPQQQRPPSQPAPSTGESQTIPPASHTPTPTTTVITTPAVAPPSQPSPAPMSAEAPSTTGKFNL